MPRLCKLQVGSLCRLLRRWLRSAGLLVRAGYEMYRAYGSRDQLVPSWKPLQLITSLLSKATIATSLPVGRRRETN